MSYPTYLSGWQTLAEEVDAELARARRKFPNSDLVVTAMSEEVGEAVRAVLEHYYVVRRNESREDIKEKRAHVRKEIIQAIAMLIRMETEGDHTHLLTKGEP